MEASGLYPKGHHPIDEDCLPDISGASPVAPRSSYPVKYYFVDFGISTYFPSTSTRRLVVGIDGLDQDVPELSDTVPYDPFKVDIFILGNLFRQHVYQVCSITTFLSS